MTRPFKVFIITPGGTAPAPSLGLFHELRARALLPPPSTNMKKSEIMLLKALLLSLGTLARAVCEPWCTSPCTELNGDVSYECRDCPPRTHACHPGAEGYSTWEERVAAKEARPYSSNSALTTAGRASSASKAVDQLYPDCETLRCKRVRQRLRIELQRKELGGGALSVEAPARQCARAPRKLRHVARAGGREAQFLRPRHDGLTAGGKLVKCELQRISYGELQKLSLEKRQALFERPTIITGMIDDWIARRNWTGALAC